MLGGPCLTGGWSREIHASAGFKPYPWVVSPPIFTYIYLYLPKFRLVQPKFTYILPTWMNRTWPAKIAGIGMVATQTLRLAIFSHVGSNPIQPPARRPWLYSETVGRHPVVHYQLSIALNVKEQATTCRAIASATADLPRRSPWRRRVRLAQVTITTVGW